MRDALKLIYAENIVPHLFLRKAVDRAITWHQMVDIALPSILFEDIIGSSDLDSDLLQETYKGNLDVDYYYYYYYYYY